MRRMMKAAGIPSLVGIPDVKETISITAAAIAEAFILG
jgi:hypothetical protein